MTEEKIMITLEEIKKDALRVFLIRNKEALESDVDELIDELWRLKRKIHRSNKDTHYNLLDLMQSLRDIENHVDDRYYDWHYKIYDHLDVDTLKKLEEIFPSTNTSTTTPTSDSF